MSAGDTALTFTDSTDKCSVEHWTITTNGTTAVTIGTKLKRVYSGHATWGADSAGEALQVEISHSGGKPTVTAESSGTAEVTAYVTLTGRP